MQGFLGEGHGEGLHRHFLLPNPLSLIYICIIQIRNIIVICNKILHWTVMSFVTKSNHNIYSLCIFMISILFLLLFFLKIIDKYTRMLLFLSHLHEILYIVLKLYLLWKHICMRYSGTYMHLEMKFIVFNYMLVENACTV